MISRKKQLINIVIVAAVIAALMYVVTRMVLFFGTDYSSVEKIFAGMLVVGEFFILMHSLGYAVNMARIFFAKRNRPIEEPVLFSEGQERPSVAILVAARHEPKDVLRRTFMSINALRYENKQVFFLDDSSDERYICEADELALELNLTIFRREERHGAKAGIVNDCCNTLTHSYVAVFDADQCPLPQFLDAIIPLLEGDRKLAFVQTPQFYSNIEESRVARASAFQQSVFYEYICEGKAVSDAMFCCGTNVVFRLAALRDIGGLDESSVTEDFATSIKLHFRGWKSLFYPHTSTFGMGPENLEGYFKQQFRWASGTLALFKLLLWQCVRRPFSLTFFQWCEYFLSSTYYFIGGALLILMVCPVAYILFDVPSFFVHPDIYFFAFVPYITFSMSVFYMGMGQRNYKIRDLFLGQLLGVATFSIYLKAMVCAILGVKIPFGVTSKEKGTKLSYVFLWPQLLMIFVNFVTVVWAGNRFFYEREPALLVNGFWALYHFFALAGIFYFNEEDMGKVKSKRLRSNVSFSYQTVTMQEIAGLDKSTWRICFTTFISECVAVGTQLMCKVKTRQNKSIIFDGVAVWVGKKVFLRGYETIIGVRTASQQTRKELREVLR